MGPPHESSHPEAESSAIVPGLRQLAEMSDPGSSMKTGAVAYSPVPGSEMPMSARLLSPGPLTMQSMTATLNASTPGERVFQAGNRDIRLSMTLSLSGMNVREAR